MATSTTVEVAIVGVGCIGCIRIPMFFTRLVFDFVYPKIRYIAIHHTPGMTLRRGHNRTLVQ